MGHCRKQRKLCRYAFWKKYKPGYKFWSKVDVNNLEFDIKYELQAFFDEFKELKISSIAEKANLNPSLLRQYSTGNKQLSTEQAKKIQDALHQLGNRLKRISIYA
jgi:hypothetical protein